MASSGSPTSSEVEHKVERSESDRGSSKARGCSSSIMDAHSRDHLCGSISCLASPHLCISSPGGASGFDFPRPSTSLRSSSLGLSPSSCICSPSSSKEELLVQARRQQIRAPRCSLPLGGVGHKILRCDRHSLLCPAKIIGDPTAGTHSTLSLVGSYARTLPSNMRVCAMNR